MALSKQKVINNLQVLINEADLLINNSIAANTIQWEGFQRWKSASQDSLLIVFSNQSQVFINFQQVNYLPSQSLSLAPAQEMIYFITAIKSAKEILEGSLFVVDAWWQDNNVEEPIRVIPFISYGGKRGKKIAFKIKEFLNALNVQPFIADDVPNLGLTLDQKVNLLMQFSNSAIIVMTAEDNVNGVKSGIRQNVINEYSTLKGMTNVNPRIICLKEKNAKLPSNLQSIAYNPLNNSNLESVYICIAKELKAFGFYL